MKRLLPLSLFALLALAVTPGLHAQWVKETYQLQPGWNAIYLHGDASYTTPAELFKDYPTVLEVWRWNPNPNQIQFSTSPAVPDATSSEWTIWKRDDATEQQLSAMIGQSAYLIHCDETVPGTTTVKITQTPVAPSATWLITGANFIGLPADSASSATTFQSYFASFPIAVTAPSKIYKYVGGSLDASNPVVVAPAGEHIDRNAAYWFQAATVGDFTGLVKYELPDGKGLAFGRTLSTLTVGVTNRSDSIVTLTIALDDSRLVPAPAGQTDRTGAVPLTYRTLDAATATYIETPIAGSFTVTIPANGRMDLQFGIDRKLLTGSSSALYASLLRIKDSAQMTDVYLPVTAQNADAAGLWIGYVNVNAVTSSVAGSGTTVASPFTLRVIIHVDGSGTARLLSQAFVGNLAATGHAPGVCTKESLLWSDTKKDALRIVSSHMPLDQVLDGAGSFKTGGSLQFTVNLPWDDPTNPFVHEYHPDHDNLNARFDRLNPLAAGVESYTVTRHLTFTFTAAPPNGSTVAGWGSTVYGGVYAETIDGLGGIDVTTPSVTVDGVTTPGVTTRYPLSVRGGFGLRRVSEISALTQ